MKCNLEKVIDKANEVHNHKYDYSLIHEYKNNRVKYPIVCHEKDKNGIEHGVFYQDFDHHINRKHGCPYCSGNAKRTLDSFVNDAREIHGDKYDYGKFEYAGIHSPSVIICPEHGEFLQAPNDHLRGQGCPKCKGKRIWDSRGRLTVNDLKERFKKNYGDLYDYSLFNEYTNTRTKIPVICKEHGVFYVSPNNHLRGRGCPHCKQSKIEKEVFDTLKESGVTFEAQYKYDESNHKNSLDFFIPSMGIGIECQGEQHFKPVDFANKGDEWANEQFEKNLVRDKYKRVLCENKGIKLLYYIPKKNTVPSYKSNKKFNGLYTNDNVCNNIEQLKNKIEGVSLLLP
jgi:predicted Zn-ribbon and HTH transcriptional regulator